MFLSYAALIQRVIKELRQVSGAATQLYAEDQIGNNLQDAYTILRDERFWHHLTSWTQHTLDGTTGRVSVPLVGIRDFTDVAGVYVGTNRAPMARINADINPFSLSGAYPRFVEPLDVSSDPSRQWIFRVWPLTATGTITIRARRDPANLFTDPAVLVPFDVTALTHLAAIKYASSDGGNAMHVSALQQVYNTRIDQLRRKQDTATLALDPRYGTPYGPADWEEMP